MGCLMALLRVFGRLILGAAILAGLIHTLVLSNFSQRLVQSETYTVAINETDAYNRIYDEVLVDDALSGPTGNLLGGVELDLQNEAVTLLRQIMPPAYLRQQTENNISRFTSYMRGETEPLQLYIDLRQPLNRIKTETQSEVNRHIDELEIAPPDRPDCSPDTIRRLAVESAAPISQLSRGELPQSAPSLQLMTRQCRQEQFDRWFDRVTTDPAMNSYAARILTETATRDDLRQTFIQGDTRVFLKTAAQPLVDSLTDDAIADIRRRLPPNDRLDLIQKAAEEFSDLTEDDIQTNAENIRDFLALSNGPARTAALIMLIGGAALLALIHLPNPAHALRWPGISLALSGGVCLAVGYIINSALPGQLNNLITNSASYSAGVPAPAINLAGDLMESFGQQATAGFTPEALTVTLTGAALIAVSFLANALIAAARQILPTRNRPRR